MTKIRILPENISSKIAAGEVVQRPESVVKELMENSIDAGADTVDVMIKRAGKSMIRVCDNGTGMDEEDALLCIQKHATSKIYTYNDLESISTLGFRGEALSSVSAVAQVEIKTQMKNEEIGTFIRIEDGRNIIKDKGSFSKGTCVSVKNLFFNIPARRNFMKSDTTEMKHIVDTFNKISLSHPDLSFKLFNEDQQVYTYTGGDLNNRICQVFADNMMEALIPVEERTDFLNVYGFVGEPTMLKKSKGEQYLFLNSRYVMSRQINHSVFTAYDDYLEKGDYPFFILFLELDPRKIDVNVHPSKLEVRFNDDRDVYNFILAVVKKSLGTRKLTGDLSFTDSIEGNRKLSVNNPDIKTGDSGKLDANISQSLTGSGFTDQEIDMLFRAIPENVIKSKPGAEIPPPFETQSGELYHELHKESGSVLSEEPSFIIQLHNKYILSQIKSGLLVIDQQTAHERILYEKALKRMDADLPFAQPLLFPKTFKPDTLTISLFRELSPALTKLGFLIKISGKNSVIIEGVPEDVKNGLEEKVLIEIIDEYRNTKREEKSDIKENLAKSYSGKAAIKAGDRLAEKEMRLLIDQLFATSMPYICPRGRPTVVKISLDEFDRRFGRS